MIRSSLLLLLVTLFHQPIKGQSINKVDTVLANRYNAMADSLILNSYFKQSIEYNEMASEIYGELRLYEKEYLAEIGIVEALWRLADYESARTKCTRLLKKIQTNLKTEHFLEGLAFYQLGVISFFEKEYTQAISNYNKSLSIFRNTKSLKGIKYVSNASFNLAGVYMQLGNLDDALILYLESMKSDEQIYGSDNLLLVDCYISIGNIHSYLLHYEEAKEYFQRGLSILESKGTNRATLNYYSDLFLSMADLKVSTGEHETAKDHQFQSLKYQKQLLGMNHPHYVYNYANLGAIFRALDNYDSSLYYYHKALEVHQVSNTNPEIILVDVYNGLASGYSHKLQFDKAIKFAEKSIEVADVNSGHLIGAARSYYSMGLIYKSSGDITRASQYFHKSIITYSKAFGHDHAHMAEPYIELSKIESSKNNYDKSLYFLQKSISCNLDSFEYNSSYDLPPLKGYYNALIYLTSLDLKIEACIQKYLLEDCEEDLYAAIETIAISGDIMDQIRYTYHSHSDKLGLQSKFNGLYKKAVEVMFLAYTNSNDSSYLEQCFYYIRKSKAGVLTNIFSNNNTQQIKWNVPDTLISMEKTIEKEISFYQKELYDLKYSAYKEDSLKSINFQKKIILLRNKRDSLLSGLKKNHTKYFHSKYQNNSRSIRDLQLELNKNSALIEYFETDSLFFTVVVSNNNYTILRKSKHLGFHDQIESLRNSLKLNLAINHSENYDCFVDAALDLGMFLLKEPLNILKHTNINHLIIVPFGKLSYIPFEPLLTEQPTYNDDYKSLDYILNDYSISYQYSSFMSVDQTRSSKSSESYIGFAPAYAQNPNNSAYSEVKSGSGFKAPGLTWNQEEIREISRLFDGVTYTDKQATEHNFKINLNKANILHVAAHGFVDMNEPLKSKLIFSRSDSALEDGNLHLYEIFSLEMNPELVVLSACNTGSGKLEKGEGIASLAYAFSYAGCPSMIMSHWNVNDFSTKEIMIDFYNHLSNGLTKNEALRLSKLNFIKNSDKRMSSPVYWASFSLIGDSSPVFKPDIQNSYLIVLLIAFLFTVSCLVFFNSKRLL